MDFNDFLIHTKESTPTSTEISSPITLGKLIIYGAQIIFLIQLLMVVLNYSKDWKDEKTSNSTSDVSSYDKESESIGSSSNEIIQSSMFTLKKILTFISVLPLSSFYLILKLSYNIIKFVVYTFFDYVIYFVNYWILNFPERFEEYIVNFFNNYIFRGVGYISEQYIIPAFSKTLNKTKSFLNEVFSEENYDKAVYYINRAAEVTFDKVIIPCSENISKYSVKAFHGLWNFTKEYSVKAYALGKLLLNTLTIFTLDFFEDVQVVWSGIQWFGINIAQPAASFLEDVFLTLTVRPLAYSVAFLKVFIEKTAKLVYKLCVGIVLAVPSIFAFIKAFIYKTFDVDAIKHRVHVWMCRWVYLPIWYVVYFLVNYGEKLVIEYIPNAYHALARLTGRIFSKSIVLLGVSYDYFKLGAFYTYQYAERAFKFIVEFIPFAHRMALEFSKNVYQWMNIYILPWFDTLKIIFYVIPLNIGKDVYALVRDYVISQDSLIGRNTRVIIRFSKHVGEIIFSHIIQVGQWIKTLVMSMLNIIVPHVLAVSKNIINILQELSSKLYEVIKPICIKEMDYMTEWSKKEFHHLSLLMKDLLKELGVKINENATSIYQSIINQNKKLHQSYESKKEFNKEFLYKNDT